jgi:hypothetical protein
MKSKIVMSLALILLAFISSSYITFKEQVDDAYLPIAAQVTYNKNTFIKTESCAKCHDCSNQNVVLYPMEVRLEANFISLKETKKILFEEVKTSAEAVDLSEPLFPDAFKNSIKN